MTPPCVLWDGRRTAIALRVQGAQMVVLTLSEGLQALRLGPQWRPLPQYPVRVAALLYNSAMCGSIRTRAVEKSLQAILSDPKLAYNLEHMMSTPTEEKKAKPAAKKTTATKTAPAKKAKAAVEKPKAPAKEAKAAAPAKTPAKAAAAAPTEGGRKGRPPSFDTTAKLKKGATKLEGTVREGTVREALMKAIIAGIGKPVGDVLGVQATDAGHVVKAVDINFAVEAGYVAL
ncbi:hypothetical protein KGP36_05850 [Patescibacteria group bacterium]|nr:hypothetical protein [Patescibacteria group bacterium]